MRDLPALFSELVRFQIELWNAVDARLQSEIDVSLGRFEALQVIARTPSCRVFDIADALAITVGGTSKLVDRLAESGHCLRRANPTDRRSSIIEITPAGERVLHTGRVALEDELDQRLGSAATEAELQQLHAMLRNLRAAGRRPSTASIAPIPRNEPQSGQR
jgi:DNA-binding MarR family transcriptional regulator